MSSTTRSRFGEARRRGRSCSIRRRQGRRQQGARLRRGPQVVVDDIEAARDELVGGGLDVGEVQGFPGGRFVFFKDPDGNSWAVQQIPDYGG